MTINIGVFIAKILSTVFSLLGGSLTKANVKPSNQPAVYLFYSEKTRAKTV